MSATPLPAFDHHAPLIIVYHAACLDGAAAAYALSQGLGADEESATYIPLAHYARPSAEAKIRTAAKEGAQIFFVDVAPEKDFLDELMLNAGVGHVCIIDHHKSAIEGLKGYQSPAGATAKLTTRMDAARPSAAALVWAIVRRVRGGRLRRRSQLADDGAAPDTEWQPVAGAARAWLEEADSLAALVRLELRQGSFLEGEVGVQVRLCRLDRFMTEPQRDHGAVDAGLQQFHRSAVPQHVRRHVLGDRVATNIALAHEALGEEALDQRGDVAGGLHGVTSHRRSRRRAASSINSGQAERYQ